jgi:hypothetical protein
MFGVDGYSDDDKQEDEQPYEPDDDISHNQLSLEVSNVAPYNSESVDCNGLQRR